uniref:Uncharacterized protein n=1 Tax=Avena sativa TaxID=4498 RepID=A0ACD5WWU0_AVESA
MQIHPVIFSMLHNDLFLHTCDNYLLTSINETYIFSSAMDMSIRDHIRKRRDEDDDDLMLLILPTLHHLGYLGGRQREPQHTSLLTGAEKVRELLEGHVKNCRIAFRIEPYIFKALANYLRREKLVRDTRIKFEEKLAFFLYMLSHNASYGDLRVFFGHSNDTFHHQMRRFFDIVVPALNLRFLRPPSNQVHPKIHGNNRFYPYFKVISLKYSMKIDVRIFKFKKIICSVYFAELPRCDRWNPYPCISIT